ncbi:MAG: MoaD/ThiS family protein [Alphaproteobacteria bacterium]
MTTITLRYFSWLREKLHKDREVITLSPETHDIADVLRVLYQRGGDYDILKHNQKILRYARNQQFAKQNDKIKHGDEIAIFPPITGG